ncbi:MAG: Hsp20/alpha crystallin family protein [Pleurocapsa minor HA4230-MV1]|jgi:HSP20 family protein|nr:Hsp20/alpha crystallin family protein [Pleurocapsa minor HA4230-MV1]
MALIRWQPFHEMDALQRDMNRMFEALASNEQTSMRQAFMPLAEMEQTEDAVHLKVEVPGMNANDLDVQVTKDAVMITGERKSESKSEKNGMKRSEFRYGSFSRTIPLPVPIDNNQVKGDYQDGILTLELPKVQKQENKVTKVNLGSRDSKNISESSQSNSNSQMETSSNSISEPSTEKVVVTSETGGYGNQDAWDNSQQTNSEQVSAS